MFACIARQRKIILALAAVSLFCLPLACTEEQPLKIGFIGGLTGRVADLGVAGRDGVTLAVEEQNRAGGVAGRKLQLVVKDDRQDAEQARLAVQDLIDEQVLAMIGPMTSSMAMVVKPLADAGRTVIISPTVKTDELSSQDDYFLRVTTPLSKNAGRMADYAVNRLDLNRFAVIYDTSNRAFTETWLRFFRAALEGLGGEIVTVESFSSQPEVHFLPIAQRIEEQGPQAVLLLSNAIDTALLAQQFRKIGSRVRLFSSEWAFTTDLLSFGGHAVEGMISFHSFNANSQNRDYLAFRDRFTKRFGYAPSFASVLAYDAAVFLIAGLAENPARDGLKQVLLDQEAFPGLQSQFVVDRFGDVERRLFLTVVKDGEFKVVDAP